MNEQKMQQLLFDPTEYDMDDLFNQFDSSLLHHSRCVAVNSAFMTEYADPMLFNYGVYNPTRLSWIAYMGGFYHDVGKCILSLPTDKTKDQRHPGIGAEFLQENKTILFNNEAEAQMVIHMALYHHERPDGKGFPYRLRSKHIPLAAQICAVADWLDQRLKKRPDAKIADIAKGIKKRSGINFGEMAVECLEKALPQIIAQYEKWHRMETQDSLNKKEGVV